MLANLFVYNKIVHVTSENILHIYLFHQTSILNTIILIDYDQIHKTSQVYRLLVQR